MSLTYLNPSEVIRPKQCVTVFFHVDFILKEVTGSAPVSLLLAYRPSVESKTDCRWRAKKRREVEEEKKRQRNGVKAERVQPESGDKRGGTTQEDYCSLYHYY